jgi:signal transduction histidine kinase
VVEEFLDYARTRPLAREPVDLAGLLGEVSDLVQPLAAERGISITLEATGNARADRDQLRRAALNLVRNAVEASPLTGEVELSARVADGEAVLEIFDRGPGLAPEARERLFRPFFTTKERGTGLGLAHAKQVADAHGGRRARGDRPGGGTVARLVLPSSA